MKKLIFLILIVFSILPMTKQSEGNKIKKDLDKIISDINQNYIYLNEKNVDLNCIRDFYAEQISDIRNEEETVLFFEYLLDEFSDSHLILNTNRNSSYRLYSSLYATIDKEKAMISNVWQTQIESLERNLVGAEIVKINGINFNASIEKFPTRCNNKNSPEVKEWILNKVLAGRYNEPRILTLKLVEEDTIVFDLDKLKLKSDSGLLSAQINNGIGLIRINNTLGNNNLIDNFDKTLKELMETKGLIIDLRNTVDGGNTYVARGIMSRFISQKEPYQKHWTNEKNWIEYVEPRGKQYTKPVVILVGRWTGSMGEGLAIGFEGMNRAEIVGSKMERLAGEMNDFSFINQRFGYRLSTAKLFHINGMPREKYIPTNYVEQTTTEKDETLEKGLDLIRKAISKN